jgi:hypothetical protein
MISVITMGIAITLSGSALAEQTKDGSIVAPRVASASLNLKPLSVQPQNIGTGARLAVFLKAVARVYLYKNVASITTPSAGAYCIKPKPSNLLGNLTQIVPVVSVEWGTSSALVSDGLMAYYLAPAPNGANLNCPSGTIEVVTYDDNYGNPTRSGGISFTLIIP